MGSLLFSINIISNTLKKPQSHIAKSLTDEYNNEQQESILLTIYVCLPCLSTAMPAYCPMHGTLNYAIEELS